MSDDGMTWGQVVISVFVVLVFVCIVGSLVWMIATSPHVVTPRERCERAGGIFFEGGLFGADNCVFPPQGANK